jgi:hypothetical protein
MILAAGDDHGRLAQMVSLVHSPTYPLLHPSNPEFLLSHYYAALLPWAWMKFAAPALTLKECILLGNLGYHILLAGVLAEFATRVFRAPRAALAFAFLMTFFGGLDWLTTLPHLFDHHEHWFLRAFGQWREISSMYTVSWWAVHHALGLWLILVCYLLLRHARWKQRWKKPFWVGLLLVSTLYSSLFVLVSLPFVAPRALWRIGIRLWRNGLGLLLAAVACVPAFLFFGRHSGPAFQLAWPQPVPLLVFLAGMLVLDLALLPLLVWRLRDMRGPILFFVSSWFVSSVGLNNYTMRGMLLPVAVLFACAAPRLSEFSWKRPLALAAIAFTTMGTLREAAWLCYQPLGSSPLYWRFTGRSMPENAARRGRGLTGLDRFNGEQPLPPVPLEQMDFNERDLLRVPRRGWFR